MASTPRQRPAATVCGLCGQPVAVTGKRGPVGRYHAACRDADNDFARWERAMIAVVAGLPSNAARREFRQAVLSRVMHSVNATFNGKTATPKG